MRALRAYLGLPKNVTSYGLISEVDWLLPQFQSQVRMIQQFSRILNTSSNRLLFKVYKWDYYLNNTGACKTWSTEIKNILVEHNLGQIFDSQCIFPVKSTVQLLKDSMKTKQKLLVKTNCEAKPKLRTFLTFKNFDFVPPHVGKPLTFLERKIISKLRLGILPIRMETARYIRPIIPEDERSCYCNNGETESETHFLFSCPMYSELRIKWIEKLNTDINFDMLSVVDKFDVALNQPENVRHTAQFVIRAMDLRSLLNTQY